jgi:hypothetical protein
MKEERLGWRRKGGGEKGEGNERSAGRGRIKRGKGDEAYRGTHKGSPKGRLSGTILGVLALAEDSTR